MHDWGILFFMKDPAFLFYVTDFNDGTQDYTNEEVGAYLRILLFQFSQGHLPLERIKRKLGIDFEKIWPMISAKFKQDAEGNFFNERLEFEQNKRKSFSESRRNNISKRYEVQVNNISNTHEPTYVEHMENENENRNDIVIEVKKEKVSKKIKNEIVEKSEQFIKYEDWANRNLPDLLKFKYPLTSEQLTKLIDEFGKDLVKDKLIAIGNTRDTKGRNAPKSVYLTCMTWCKMAIEKGWRPQNTEPSAIGQDVWSKNLNDLRKMREIRENNNLKLTQ
jgi:uncharacterized protein YdaU (DUF1376 family)